MLELFTELYYMLTGSMAAAITGAFLWGIASVILSPCHLSAIPLIVGFMSGGPDMSGRKAFFLSLSFSLGIILSMIILGALALWVGGIAGDFGMAGKVVASLIIIFFGFVLAGIVNVPFLDRLHAPQVKKRGIWPAFLIGTIFGVTFGPCTFAFVAPVLGIVMEVASTNMNQAVLMMVAFTIAHAGVIVVFGSSAGLVQKLLNWNEKTHRLLLVRKICGVLVILAGIYYFFK